MFSKVYPESVGISSKDVIEYLEFLNERGLNMHSVIMARGKEVFCEAYWSPYDCSTKHRMYSVTKSFVGIAVCQMAAQKLISLDDCIVKYFDDKVKKPVHPYLAAQTIRNMLDMQTCMTDNNWFGQGVTDRLCHYFEHTPSHYPGTGFYYDSSATFVLGALVERVTGLSLLDYLRKQGLNKIGFSGDAFCLKAPGGHSWSDSGLICTPMDILKVGRLIADFGEYNGEQLLDRGAVEYALKINSDSHSFGPYGYSSGGYGNYIWHSYDGAFMFNGMHDQVLLYHPKSDILFACTSGNPAGFSRELIVSGLFEKIIKRCGKASAQAPDDALENYTGKLTLNCQRGNEFSDFEKEIDNKTFILQKNDMGIEEFTLSFQKDYCTFKYQNEQGNKELRFGRAKNNICQFPQTGYSKEYGATVCEGNTYRCAASFAWPEPKRLAMNVQIIDDYIGILSIIIGFNGKNAWLQMFKQAEDFLCEYDGAADCKML